jgi:hypothetical protein
MGLRRSPRHIYLPSADRLLAMISGDLTRERAKLAIK